MVVNFGSELELVVLTRPSARARRLEIVGDAPHLAVLKHRPRGFAAIVDVVPVKLEHFPLAAVLRLSFFPRLAPVAFIMFSPAMILVGLWAGPFLRDLYGLDSAARGGVLFAMMGSVTAGLLAYGPLDRIFNTRKWVVVGGGCLIFFERSTRSESPTHRPHEAEAEILLGPLELKSSRNAREILHSRDG